jgi:CheY-like chemotaxis protein
MTSKTKAAAKSKKSPKSAAKKAPKGEDAKRPCIKVLIADDHSVVREGLASLIGRKEDMTVLAEAGNGREAVELWKRHRPDVTLLDLRMPELDGLGTIKEIRASDEHARIIVLTTFDGDEDIFPCHSSWRERLSSQGRAARGADGLHSPSARRGDVRSGSSRG